MRISKDFAPTTIVLESREDLDFLKDAIYAAQKHEDSKRFLSLCGNFSETSFQQKLKYFMGQLK